MKELMHSFLLRFDNTFWYLEKIAWEYPEEYFFKTNDESEWTPAMHLEYVVRLELWMCKYLERKTSTDWLHLRLSGLENYLGAERMKIDYLSHYFINPEPRVRPPWGDKKAPRLLEGLVRMRKRFYNLFQEMDEHFYDRLVYEHPRYGEFDVFLCMQFLELNARYHGQKMNFILLKHKEIAALKVPA